MKKEVKRGFNFPDAELITTGKGKIAFMRRDISEFETYGIDSVDIDKLESDIETFSDNVTDMEVLGRQVLSTEAKDAKAEQLREGIRQVMTRVILKYNAGSTKYKMFGTELLSRQTDSELMVTAKRVYRLAKEELPVFVPHGLNEDMISVILTYREEFDDLMVDQKINIGLRDDLQEDRVEEGNAIFETLMSYTTTGMSIWQSSDVAKYNDYVIYNTISGEAPSEPTL